VITLDEHFQVIHTDRKVRARETAQELVQTCNAQLLASDLVVPNDKIAAFSSCMESQIGTTLNQKQEERQFQSQLRDTMASQLVHYACNDLEFNTTEEHLNRTWHYEEMEGLVKEYQMRVVHERPSSNIFYIPKFASTKECQASINSIENDSNAIPWSALDAFGTESIILHNLVSKVYELARTTLQLPELQSSLDKAMEDSSIFQVHQDNEASYFAECDATTSNGEEEQGVCEVTTSSSSKTLLPTKPFQVDDPNQLGTAFLFCDVPKQGGAIHFPSAGIHIQPTPGMLVFATHRQAKHDTLDGFVQEYHMCPHHHILTHSFVQP
jgi:hypothetical protein